MWLQNRTSGRVGKVAGQAGKLVPSPDDIIQVLCPRKSPSIGYERNPWKLRDVELAPEELIPKK